MKLPTFVSFATWNYRHHARGLKLSLNRFHLSHDIHTVTSRGSWQANCHRKPAFLRSMLMKHNGPIVWIDADARMRQEPQLLLEMAATRHADIGVHNYGLSGGRSEILSGTVYLDNTSAAHDLLDAWQDQCKAHPGAFDQQCLQWALAEEDLHEHAMGSLAPPLRVAALPAEYCFIHDVFRAPFYRRNHPNVGEPVIEHLQASRAVRKLEREAAQ